jgi:ABC transporter substrate binding protein
LLMSVDESDPEAQRYIKTFLQGLQELGWAHGRNVEIEYRWGAANLDRIRTYAAELVGLKPDVILAQTALVVAPLQRETSTVPIIFMQIVDPVESGFVASLARPGGNLTGFTPFEFSTATKWLERQPKSGRSAPEIPAPSAYSPLPEWANSLRSA